MKGYLALDIDGTLTDESHGIPDEVAMYLTERIKEGWELVLLTGRIFSFAMRSLEKLNFPFFLVVQNGSDIISMPARKVVSRSYLLRPPVEDFYSLAVQENLPFVLYAGFDQGDFCYYDPSLFDEKMTKYLDLLRPLAAEEWQTFSKFSAVEQDTFPLIKAFGTEDRLAQIEAMFLKDHSLQTTTIVDPIDPSLSMLMTTAVDVNKGLAFRRVQKILPIDGPIIAAGNDNNDIPLLQIADIAIAVGEPPQGLKKYADYITPPSTQLGIIEGIDYAIDKFS